MGVLNNNKESVLKVKNLTVSFSRYDRGWNKTNLQVIHSLDVEVFSGEILAAREKAFWRIRF